MSNSESNCIGYSTNLKIEVLIDLVLKLRACPNFNDSRIPEDSDFPISEWVSNIIPSFGGFAFESENIKLDIENVSGGASTDKLIFAVPNVHTRVEHDIRKSISSHVNCTKMVCGYMTRDDGPLYFVEVYEEVTKVGDFQHGIAFLRELSKVLGFEELISYTIAGANSKFSISQNMNGSVKLLGDRKSELAGYPNPFFALGCYAKKEMDELKRKLELHLGGKSRVSSWWVEFDSLREYRKLSDKIQALSKPPYLIEADISSSCIGWGHEKIRSDGGKTDSFPVGRLDFSSPRVKGLSGLHVCIDAFLEPSGWTLGFHLFEESVGKKSREKVRTAINTHLGQDIIVRTPETMWP